MVKVGIAAALLAICPIASCSNGMTKVPENARFCAGQDSYCYEWALRSDPSIRLIAWGDEESIEYSFRRRGRYGQYKFLFRFHPVIVDASRKKSLYWGYPWDIEDIALTRSGDVLATFKHGMSSDEEITFQPWQKRVPVVLFLGRTTQPDMSVPRMHFGRSSIRTLIKQVSAGVPPESTTERVLRYTAELEKSPHGADAIRKRQWLLQWIQETKDYTVTVCEVLGPIPSQSPPNSAELLSQQMFGNAAYQIRNPGTGDALSAQVAGVESTLNAYTALLGESAKNRIPFLDDLLAKRASGSIRSHLAPIVEQACSGKEHN